MRRVESVALLPSSSPPGASGLNPFTASRSAGTQQQIAGFPLFSVSATRTKSNFLASCLGDPGRLALGAQS
jgi:hypothetical protein